MKNSVKYQHKQIQQYIVFFVVAVSLAFISATAALAYTGGPFAASGGQVYFEGEGYITPTEASQVPFDRKLLIGREQLNKSIASTSGAAGNTVVVNALATNFPNIVLYLTARDSSGNYITGLQASQFAITEQSSNETSPHAETITGFSESSSSGSGISISLVFDVSGSMSGQPLADAKTAAINFVKACSPTDRMALVKFASYNEVSVVRSSDWVNVDADKNGTADIIDAINSLTIGGLTALFDGTAKGIETLSQEPQPKAVIVFTDGGENNSSVGNNINAVITMAQNNSVPLYTIGLGGVYDDATLKNMANATGGLYFPAPSAQDMAGIYANIAKGIKEQYVIGYTTHNPLFDGTTRTVTTTAQGTSGLAVYVVNSKPVITLSQDTLLLSTQSQQPNVMLPISGWVTDLDAQTQGQNLTAALYYRFANATTFTEVALTLTNQGSGKYSFNGQIPGSVVKEPGILYYLHASDGLLETYSPFNYNVLPYSIPVLQNHSPIILHTPVTSATINQPVTILAKVTDPDSGDSVSKVEIYYRIHDAGQSTPYLVVSMTSSNGVDFSGIIPGDKFTAAGVDYFISAWDDHLVRADTRESYITVGPGSGVMLVGSNSIEDIDVVKITDMSGSLSAGGGAVIVKAWDKDGKELSAAGSALPITVKNHGTTSIKGADLEYRFLGGTPASYTFAVESSKMFITNVNNSFDMAVKVPIIFTNGLSNFASNSIGTRNTIKVTDMSGTIGSSGIPIVINAWDATGKAIPESTSAGALKLYNHGTTTIAGSSLTARFPMGTPVTYEFTIASPKLIVSNVKNSSDRTLNIPNVYTIGVSEFVSNSIGSRNTIWISDFSGVLAIGGAAINVRAWNASVTEIQESE